MTKSVISEEVGGSLGAEDEARAESVRNLSESTTDAGRWRLIERMLNTRATELDERERRVADREAAVAVGAKEAEIKARVAAVAILEEASLKATAIIKTALEEAGQLGQKAAVDAGAIRQAAQDHLVAGIALADAARLPPKTPPTGSEMLVKLGETFLERAGSAFDRLMVANPAASARLAGGIADVIGREPAPTESATPTATSHGPTFNEIAAAAEAIGQKAMSEFLASRGVKEFADLTITDSEALLALARKEAKEPGNAAG